jgi:hypothetical protein
LQGFLGFFSDDLADTGFRDSHGVMRSGFKYTQSFVFCMRQENDFKFAPSEAPEIGKDRQQFTKGFWAFLRPDITNHLSCHC